MEPQRPAGDQAIVMLRHDLNGLPRVELPGGFVARGMTPDDVPAWTRLWRELEPPGRIGDALFATEFGARWDEIRQRCFLILAPDGGVAGTISAWFNDSFKGGEWGRIHWVAVGKAFQGKGLGKAMLSLAMEAMVSRHNRCYLVTHAYRMPAVSLYLKFGFVPDLTAAESRPLWERVAGNLKDPALREALLKHMAAAQA
jgi:GNAT superfamily N-acetyltransferase